MKLAFVHIPKTAGGSVIDWFRNYSPDKLVNPGHVLLKNFNQDYDKSFSIVRNTYHRFISAYVFAKEYGPKKYIKRVKKNNLKDIDKLRRTLDATEKGIVYWLNYLIETENNTAYDLFTWTKDVDIILRQENLDTEFDIIRSFTNVYIPLQRTRHVMNYNRDQFLTKEYINFLDKHYEKEIEFYKYKP